MGAVREEPQVETQENMWTAVSQLLRAQVSDAVWYSTFNDIHALPSDDPVVRLAVPSGTVRDKILSRYLPLVTDALNEIGLGSRQLEVEVVAPTEVSRQAADVAEVAASTNATRTATLVRTPVESPAERAGLNPRYTFETFVRGASNSFALAAAQRVAETPARSYNPLFIYGSAGLGKTHLLHAIGHYVIQNYSHYQVRYITCLLYTSDAADE